MPDVLQVREVCSPIKANRSEVTLALQPRTTPSVESEFLGSVDGLLASTPSCGRAQALEGACPGSESHPPCRVCGERGSLIPDPSANPPHVFMVPAMEPTFRMECKLCLQTPSGIEQKRRSSGHSFGSVRLSQGLSAFVF